MPENDDKDLGQNEQTAIAEDINQPSPTLEVMPVGLPTSLRWTFVVGGALLFALLVVSYLHPYMTERVKFFTGNALSLLLLVVIIVQAIIYRRQWAVMERQGETMREQLAEAKTAVGINEDMMRAMQGQLDIMREQTKAIEIQAQAAQTTAKAAEEAAEAGYIAQRAYIGIADLRMECQAVGATAPIVVGAIPTLYVTWHNGGSTPARNFRAVPYLVYGDKPEWQAYYLDDDDSDIKGSFLPAGKEVTIPYPQAQVGFRRFTKEMADDLLSGKTRLYAMVMGVYIDYAGKTRSFETGAIWKPYEGGFTELHEYTKQE